MTFTTGGWGAPPNGGNAGNLLASNVTSVYPDGVTIGGSHKYLACRTRCSPATVGTSGGDITMNFHNGTQDNGFLVR